MAHITVGDLHDLANQRVAQQGNVKHYELNLRRRGLYDPMPPDWNPQPVGVPSQLNHGVQLGSVTFVGVPIPPTPEEVKQFGPPPGSSVIIPAPPLPPMPRRPPAPELKG